MQQKIKIGITGQSGFIGTHLYNTLGLSPDKYERVPFLDMFFTDFESLCHFVGQCDILIHLAAVNRHTDLEELYTTNIKLTEWVIKATEHLGHFPHVFFSSSIQENLDNLYGQSKRECRRLLEEWADKNNAQLTSLIIPNVFGPFGQPFHNSVVATFCHQITRNERPAIINDANLKLIYVTELVEFICGILDKSGESLSTYTVPHTIEITVSELLNKLTGYWDSYSNANVIPELKGKTDIAFFNTLRSYIDFSSYSATILDKKTDQRGFLVECIKSLTGGQVFFSKTKPGITRGNHFHTRKIERFCVIEGEAIIRLRRIGTKEIHSIHLSDSSIGYVDIPIWFTHNISNVGKGELLTLFWTNEMFNPNDSDTFFEEVGIS